MKRLTSSCVTAGFLFVFASRIHSMPNIECAALRFVAAPSTSRFNRKSRQRLIPLVKAIYSRRSHSNFFFPFLQSVVQAHVWLRRKMGRYYCQHLEWMLRHGFEVLTALKVHVLLQEKIHVSTVSPVAKEMMGNCIVCCGEGWTDTCRRMDVLWVLRYRWVA